MSSWVRHWYSSSGDVEVVFTGETGVVIGEVRTLVDFFVTGVFLFLPLLSLVLGLLEVIGESIILSIWNPLKV